MTSTSKYQLNVLVLHRINESELCLRILVPQTELAMSPVTASEKISAFCENE
jgi:hypothetical protein